MKPSKLLMAAVLAATVGVPIASFAEERNMSEQTTSKEERLAFLHGLFTRPAAGQSQLTSLSSANDWLNSPPLTVDALRGKVVLVGFWTYRGGSMKAVHKGSASAAEISTLWSRISARA